jgi:hypothetical protein
MLLGIAFLVAGCVPVTEPLADPDKSEPDKRLLGKWRAKDESEGPTIDSPLVKGNPKGLMRSGNQARSRWFFTTSIGKHTYANVCFNRDGERPNFDKEGAFEKWKKSNNRCYFIVRYLLDGDKLTIDFGHEPAVEKVMKAQQIELDNNIPYQVHPYKTPPGLLARYLEKNGPETIFTGTPVLVLRRSKD